MKTVEINIPHLGYQGRFKESYFEQGLVENKLSVNPVDQIAIRKRLNGMPDKAVLYVELFPESHIFLAIQTITHKPQ